MKLKIPSSTEELFTVREFIAEAARSFGFEDESIGKIALAVDEACTNIIKHAYSYERDKEIEITVNPNNDKFEIVIVDYGKSFNPKLIKIPDMSEYRTKYRKGGLGMYLMYSLMDKIEYKKLDHRNEVHLIKYLSRKDFISNNLKK